MNTPFNRTVLGASLIAAMSVSPAAFSQDSVKVGVLLGFTGPIESLTPNMAGGAEVALKEASDSGLLLDGLTVEPVRADSTCVDASAATAAAERLVTSDNIVALVGADCSCLLYTSPSPRDKRQSRMPSSA